VKKIEFNIPRMLMWMKVKTLGVEGERLTEIHPNQAEDIRSKQAEIEGNWEKLRKKVR